MSDTSNRTSLRDAFLLAKRPILAFNILNGVGVVTIIVTILLYEHNDRSIWQVPLFFGLGFAMGPVGQVLALRRLRAAPMFLIGLVWGAFLIFLLEQRFAREDFVIAVLLGSFGFFSGFLSLQRGLELFATVMPAIGWVGSVMTILNHEGRASVWAQNKHGAWLSSTLILMVAFTALFAVYLAQKQTYQVTLWQHLAGRTGRRIPRTQAVPLRRKNLGALAVLVVVLFGLATFVAPYLWRTGRGHQEVKDGAPNRTTEQWERFRSPTERFFEVLERSLRSVEETAKDSFPWLLALLATLVGRRPFLRYWTLRQLRWPLFAKSPSTSIDDQWTLVRIAAEDASIPMLPSDSVEDLVARIEARGGEMASVQAVARVYSQARYGLGIRPGDVMLAKSAAPQAFQSIVQPLSFWTRFKNQYRPL